MELSDTLKRIILITTGQPSCNPRIVKEANALTAAGYDVTVLYSFFIQWAEDKDAELLKKVKWKYKQIGGSPTGNKKLYWYTRLRFKLANKLSNSSINRGAIAEQAQARAFKELLQEAKSLQADWYIGHNLGTLAVAVKAAQHNGTKAGFDFEDYHRGEGHTDEVLKRTIYLEEKYLPSLSYFSGASETITSKTSENHPGFCGKTITLLNCFPLANQPLLNLKRDTDQSLHLFWFSQTIGLNRGIELLIEALNLINNKSIHLTLAGRCSNEIVDFMNKQINKFPNIHFTGVIQPEKLPFLSSNFDVGLALETGFSINNDIALSNKIFTYLLAGNAVVLSNTTMQSAFNAKYKIGESFAVNDAASLAHKISSYFDTNKLNAQKQYNYKLAKEIFNWENESKKLLEVLS